MNPSQLARSWPSLGPGACKGAQATFAHGTPAEPGEKEALPLPALSWVDIPELPAKGRVLEQTWNMFGS